MHGLVEHRIDEEVAGGVPVVEVDGEPDGTPGKSVGRNEGVSNCGLLPGFHCLAEGGCCEVLDVEGEVCKRRRLV